MDIQRLLDNHAIGDFDYVQKHIDEVEVGNEDDLNYLRELTEAALGKDTQTLSAVFTLLDQRTPAEERRKMWIKLRATVNKLPDVTYALGLCSLTGDLCGPSDMSDVNETYANLSKDPSPRARVLALLYAIAAGRPDLALRELSNISRVECDSFMPEMAQIWTELIKGSSTDAYQCCCEIEDFIGINGDAREIKSEYLANLKGTTLLQAHKFREALPLLGDEGVEAINKACALANLDMYLDDALERVKEELPQSHPYHKALLELDTLEQETLATE